MAPKTCEFRTFEKVKQSRSWAGIVILVEEKEKKVKISFI